MALDDREVLNVLSEGLDMIRNQYKTCEKTKSHVVRISKAIEKEVEAIIKDDGEYKAAAVIYSCYSAIKSVCNELE